MKIWKNFLERNLVRLKFKKPSELGIAKEKLKAQIKYLLIEEYFNWYNYSGNMEDINGLIIHCKIRAYIDNADPSIKDSPFNIKIGIFMEDSMTPKYFVRPEGSKGSVIPNIDIDNELKEAIELNMLKSKLFWTLPEKERKLIIEYNKASWRGETA